VTDITDEDLNGILRGFPITQAEAETIAYELLRDKERISDLENTALHNADDLRAKDKRIAELEKQVDDYQNITVLDRATKLCNAMGKDINDYDSDHGFDGCIDRIVDDIVSVLNEKEL